MTRIVVVGGGPAGIAAACGASECGAIVTVVDDNPEVGGQIWRVGKRASSGLAAPWFRRFSQCKAEVISGARVVSGGVHEGLVLEIGSRQRVVQFDKVILATGARELYLPFPGWTLPGVFGAGGLQALVKSGLPVKRKRVVVAGSGPLLLAVAAFLKSKGAKVIAIVEQARFGDLAAFAAGLAGDSSKLLQAASLRWQLRGIPYQTGSWIQSAEGDSQIREVRIANGGHLRNEPCDYLAIGYGLIPNTELAELLGCAVGPDGVTVDEHQRTTRPEVYSAGEATGIGGVDLALLEGEIAAYAASGQPERAAALYGKRRRAAVFARSLAAAFRLRPELRALVRPGTIVCRCEDVPFQELAEHTGWRQAKLQTRCGMGPCQGRICGAATGFLLGWKNFGVRPPVLPARVGTLLVQDKEIV